MEVICGIKGIVDAKWPGKGIADIARAGFKTIMLDLSVYCTPGMFNKLEKEGERGGITDDTEQNFAEHPEKMREAVSQVISICQSEKIWIGMARAPYIDRNTEQRGLNERLIKTAEESIRICGKTGCSYLVVRPLTAGIERGGEWDRNREYYLALAETAGENHVMLLLENQCRNVNGHVVRGICSDGCTAAEWIDRLNEEAGEERFGFCMDVGTANVCGQKLHDFARVLGERLKAVILRDCNGNRESSMLPFTCVNKGRPQTDWLGLIRGLRDICFDGRLIMDFADTAGCFSPILRPHLMELAKAEADYFVWQAGMEGVLSRYKSRVLFGAGRMCRNYMKCYGEKYKPLFTCDNNRASWGTSLCGIEVKPPESLQELPPDCAIIICNMYYREVKKQLQDMGIKNPIECFSDEYMPHYL